MSIFEVYQLAKKYYPHLWSAARLEALVDAGKLARADADRIMADAGQ